MILRKTTVQQQSILFWRYEIPMVQFSLFSLFVYFFLYNSCVFYIGAIKRLMVYLDWLMPRAREKLLASVQSFWSLFTITHYYIYILVYCGEFIILTMAIQPWTRKRKQEHGFSKKVEISKFHWQIILKKMTIISMESRAWAYGQVSHFMYLNSWATSWDIL